MTSRLGKSASARRRRISARGRSRDVRARDRATDSRSRRHGEFERGRGETRRRTRRAGPRRDPDASREENAIASCTRHPRPRDFSARRAAASETPRPRATRRERRAIRTCARPTLTANVPFCISLAMSSVCAVVRCDARVGVSAPTFREMGPTWPRRTPDFRRAMPLGTQLHTFGTVPATYAPLELLSYLRTKVLLYESTFVRKYFRSILCLSLHTILYV